MNTQPILPTGIGAIAGLAVGFATEAGKWTALWAVAGGVAGWGINFLAQNNAGTIAPAASTEKKAAEEQSNAVGRIGAKQISTNINSAKDYCKKNGGTWNGNIPDCVWSSSKINSLMGSMGQDKFREVMSRSSVEAKNNILI